MGEDILDKVLKVLNTNLENTKITFEQPEENLSAIDIENIEITSEQIDEDLSALGMDSITFIRIIVDLEEEFDIEIPDEKLLLTEMNTISKITDVISAVLEKKQEDNAIGE